MPNTHRRTRPQQAQPLAPRRSDAWLIDDEFDDFLDHHVAALRESLADVHHR